MAGTRERVSTLLREKPELESSLRSVVEVDEEHETWEFDDVPIDSGDFGEIVSADVVEDTGDGYRLADPTAVRAALEGSDRITADGATATTGGIRDDASGESVGLRASLLDGVFASDRRHLLSLTGLVSLVVLVRVLFIYPSVLRPENVVLAGNDPYRRLFYVEQLLGEPFGLGTLGSFSSGLAESNPLLVTIAWVGAELLGGTSHAARVVLATYPVVAGVATAGAVYLLAMAVTNDRRVGYAAVLLLALNPMHGFRTALGFGDHHALNYLWLVLTAYGLTVAVPSVGADRSLSPTDLVTPGVALVAVGFAGQVLSWRAAPLLFLPVWAFLVARGAAAVRADESPVAAIAPVLAASCVAGLCTLTIHVTLGWAARFNALSPLAFCGAAVVLAGVYSAAERFELSETATVASGVSVGGVVAGVLVVAGPRFRSALSTFTDYIVQTGASDIAETASLFSGALGVVVSPVLYFGFTLPLALGYGWIYLRRGFRDGDTPLLVVCTYFWVILALATLQLRFAGQLSMFVAVLGGAGTVSLAHWVDLARPLEASDEKRVVQSVPSTRTVVSLAVVVLLVVNISAVITPIKMGQVAVDDDTYETAMEIEAYAETSGTDSRPDYVLSWWSQNRVLNYFVNGRSERYSYARENYLPFVESTEPGSWYDRFRDRVRFVVTRSLDDPSPETVQSRLHDSLGSASSDGVAGVSHYRFVAEAGDRKVFELVEGATITGVGDPNTTRTINTTLTVDGRTFAYERRVQTTRTGAYAVTVPYAGTYSDGGSERSVPEDDVTEGHFVGDTTRTAHWTFDAGRGDVAFDLEGGNHGRVEGANWTSGVERRGLRFDGADDHVTVRDDSELDGSGAFTVSLWVRTDPDLDYSETGRRGRLVANVASGSGYQETDGYQLGIAGGEIRGAIGDGDGAGVAYGPSVADGSWHHVVMTYDGSRLRLYVDGEQRAQASYSGAISADSGVVFGSGDTNGWRAFHGRLDEVRYRSESVAPETVRQWYDEMPSDETR